MAAAFLVLTLSIFSASPTLHAWLHSHGASPHAQATDHGAPLQDHGDDSCAVTMFAHGALALLVAFVLACAFQRAIAVFFSYVAALYRATPRYWLPPLCGPPLS
jgi:hypothetical protein